MIDQPQLDTEYSDVRGSTGLAERMPAQEFSRRDETVDAVVATA